MLGIVFALIAFLGWGVGDIFGTLATRRLGSLSTSAWSMAAGVLISVLFIPLIHSTIQNLTLSILAINILLGLIFLLGMICFNEGLRVGNPSLVGTIAASFAAVSVVLSVIFLKEKISTNQMFSIALIFLGLILSSLHTASKESKNTCLTGVIFALITTITWGIYYAFIKIPVESIGWFWPQLITLSLFPVVFYFMSVRRKKVQIPSLKHNALFLVLINGFLVGGGEFAYNFAISNGYTAVVAPIAGSYPVLFVILASFIFKEKTTLRQNFGILTTLLGIVFLSILSI